MAQNTDLSKIFQSAQLNDIVGQERVKKQLKGALLANHHIIIEGPPGVGKTTLAKNVSKILPPIKKEKTLWNKEGKKGERFIRVQGSPDLTAEDLLGDIDPIKALEFGPLSVEAFTPGKLFKAHQGVLFFDELNRAPEKLQNALLQVLEEGKVTLGSYDVDFPLDFILIATMNPTDTNTEKLSDVLLDRFDVIVMGYPEKLEHEKEIVQSKGKNIASFPDNLLSFVVNFVRELRMDKDLEKVPGVRATLALYNRSQTQALLENRNTVKLVDIKAVLQSVLAHRIELKPSLRYVRDKEDFVSEKFKQFLVENKKSVPHGGDGL